MINPKVNYQKVAETYQKRLARALYHPDLKKERALFLKAPLQNYFRQLFINLQPRVEFELDSYLRADEPVETDKSYLDDFAPTIPGAVELLFALLNEVADNDLTSLARLKFLQDEIRLQIDNVKEEMAAIEAAFE